MGPYEFDSRLQETRPDVATRPPRRANDGHSNGLRRHVRYVVLLNCVLYSVIKDDCDAWDRQ